MNAKYIIILAALLGMTGVALGAFGAHGLEDTLIENDRVDTFNTASRYHMYHALALLALAWMATRRPSPWVNRAAVMLMLGTLLFSGSLYVLAIADLGIMGAVAPLGGTALIVGWALMAWAAWRDWGPADHS